MKSSAPNVLLITTDHWPAALLGCAGHPVVQTPTLDALARSGTRFTNACSECPICIPARRTLMTGLDPRSHGDWTFQTQLPMPDVPTLAQCFRDAGYQAFGVGKLHVFPQRDRIGFDDVLLAEEGRPQWGVVDDYDAWLGEQGYAGRQFEHGMSNNDYLARPWHLPEKMHVTSWITRQMARTIRRRDPTRPGFWYLSYTHPHPPLVPTQTYWDIYRDVEPEWPTYGDWVPREWQIAACESDKASNSVSRVAVVPASLRSMHDSWQMRTLTVIRTALRAFYALCTQIDHQLRVVLGTLREEGLLERTIILFTSDHGDMLGRHGLWAKRLFYQPSTNVPMILVGPRGDDRIRPGEVDDRLCGLQDVMPTLLSLAGIGPPKGCDGRSLVEEGRRDVFFGECNDGPMATRMVRDERYKLIYYPCGNVVQLFDLQQDPQERDDCSSSPAEATILARLTGQLIQRMTDVERQLWVGADGALAGLPAADIPPDEARDLHLQRGTHWPPPTGQVPS